MPRSTNRKRRLDQRGHVGRFLSPRHRALAAEFRRLFDHDPATVVRAPGRVNLIGEHTDYNEGFVLPIALDRDVLIAARPRAGRTVVAHSIDYDRDCRFSLDTLKANAAEPWSEYLRGVALVLQVRGFELPGMEVAISGNVPPGAGLSSSAALELATAWAFQVLGGFRLDPPQLALVCQHAESEVVGVHCGIMDQFVSALARRGHALFLDCRDLSYRHVPLPDDVNLVITDSTLRRDLAHSNYNQRRAECAEALQLLHARLPHVRSLRDLTWSQLALNGQLLPEHLRRRCRHVVSENERVLRSVVALEQGDADLMGSLLFESHDSLRGDYEVSLPELDILVDSARKAGALGARLTGAGFGGCIVSLVPGAATAAFPRLVAEAYGRHTGRQAESYVCEAGEGAGVVATDV